MTAVRGKCRAQGLTLLELLLAVAVFALVGLAAATALTSVLEGREHYQQRSDQLDRVELVFTLLARDLSQMAVTARLRDSDGDVMDGPWQFSEQDKQLEWLTLNVWAAEVSSSSPSFDRVRWSWDNSELMRSAMPLRNPDRSAAPAAQQALIKINNLRWRFFHRGRWQAYPPADDQLPGGLALTLELPGAGQISRQFLLPDSLPPEAPSRAERGNQQ